MMPRLAEVLKRCTKAELIGRLESIGLPYAPIAKPWDLLDDPHLSSSGGLLETKINSRSIRVPALPLSLGGKRLAKRADPPRVGQHGRELLAELGCSPQDIQGLVDRHIVALP
jgi:crotonobetainyl-CoA:carnitine CoA-transferase CaiB-like acyl-CoA transferase